VNIDAGFKAMQALGLFREAVQGLIPVLDAAGVAWRDGDAYDDFDDVASALYIALVLHPLTNEADSILPLADYDMLREDYSDVSFLRHEGGAESAIFNRLVPGDGGFAHVELVPIDAQLHRTGQAFQVPFATCSLALEIRRDSP
jgi:hypothetical protein